MGRKLVAVVTMVGVACGARTGLLVPNDASIADAHVADVVVSDIAFEAPDFGEAGPLTCEQAVQQKVSAGCDFVIPTPSFYALIAPPCWAVFVANDGVVPVHVQVERAGQSYDVTQFGRLAGHGTDVPSWPFIPSSGIPPGAVAVLFMDQDPSSTNEQFPMTCPITPAISQPFGSAIKGSGTSQAITGRGTAWHLVTDQPVQVFDILPYGGADTFLPSAELVFPTASFGTNYFGVVPQRGTNAPQWAQVVAAEDGTTVTVFPSVTLPSGNGVPTAPANVATTFTLNAGEYIQWQDSHEMSGTIIQSSAPVGFFGGHGYICYSDLTSTGGGCESAHQQVMPIVAFGSEYAVAAYTTRLASGDPESIRYRFVGAAGGTNLVYEPPVATAPSSLGKGQIADFETTSSFVVRSQDSNHPFYVAQLMTGCQLTAPTWNNGCLGDEEYVDVLAPAQFRSDYVFFTDPTYKSTNLVFTRERGPNGFEDVTLDCLAGPVTGWKNIDPAGQYQMANVWLVKVGTPQGACDNGQQFAKSNGKFAVTVWGLDSYASYAYPAGGTIAPINSLVVPAGP